MKTLEYAAAAHTPYRQPGRWKTLHLAWIAFFLSFVVWFNLAPFKTTIGKALHLSEAQLNTLLICNVALTVPARIIIGMLVDRFGPRRVYTGLLLTVAAPCIGCAISTNYMQLVICRLLVSCVGAGFVVGIRMVGEWFEKTEIGWAEGIYGGLGNFGMAAATFGLPLVALVFGGANGWRYAMILSGLGAAAYAFVFYRFAQDTPSGVEYKKPKGRGALDVCSKPQLVSLCLMQVPMAVCLGILAWRLTIVKLISVNFSYGIYVVLGLLVAQQVYKIITVNRGILAGEIVPAGERYSFVQVAILCLCYAVTFGGELAVESMLPGYFEKMFKVSVALAGVMGAGFAFASLIARPFGGWLGDRIGRKPIMVVTLFGSTLGFFAIKMIDAHWSLTAAMTVVVIVGLFLMAGNGANFCIAPLIRKPLTGQIAGLIGAYGNVGSVMFLAVLTLAGPRVFFISMGITGAAAFLACLFLREPGRETVKVMAIASAPIADDVALELQPG